MFIRASFIALTLALTIIAAPVKRDASQVLSDLQNLDQQAQNLGSSLSSFPDSGGSILQALPIQNSATQLDSSIQSTTNDVNNNDYFGDSDANNFLSEIQNNLAPSIQSSLNTAVGKQPAFSALGVDSTILSDLQNLQADTNALGNALAGKVPGDVQGAIQDQINAITGYFSSAMGVYSN